MKRVGVVNILLLSSAALLSACSGDNLLTGGGETGTGYTPVAYGKITGFGSIFVNGVEFDTVNSQIKLDGAVETEAKLKIGMVVHVSGSINTDGKTGAAQLVEFEDNVEGMVQSISTDTTGAVTLTVMGQTVKTDANTMVEGVINRTNLIPVNALVEVSGHTSGDGIIYATLVNVKKNQISSDEKMEVKGVVANWNSAAQTFTLGALTVYIGSVSEIKNISELRNDIYVKAEGKYDTTNSRLNAQEVEFKSEKSSRISGNTGSKIKLEGVVTKIVTPGEAIEVNGQPVRFASTIKDAVLNLATGNEIEVEGTFESDGAILVSQIEQEHKGDLEITATVQSVDATNLQFTLFGKTFVVTGSTQMKDGTGVERSFTISKLYANNRVDLTAYHDATNNRYVVTSLERKTVERDENDEIRGTITAIPAAGQYEINGILVKDPNNYVSAKNYSVGNFVELEVTRENTGDINVAKD